MRQNFRNALLAGIFLTFTAGPSLAAKRVALVIGNAKYQAVSELVNPGNDAVAIAQALRDIGFDEVLLHADLDHHGLLSELKSFARLSVGAETAVVYYAGHGVEVDGENYLIPTDAALAQATDVKFEAVPLENVRAALAGATKLRIIIMDACRNNPFKLAGGDSSRSVGRGLARVEPGSNELIAYAAKEGTLASDGADSGHSPYAAALAKHLTEPGLEIRLLFGRVRDDVMAATQMTQEPFVYGSLGGEAIYINPARSLAIAPVTKETPIAEPAKLAISSDAERAWTLIKNTNDIEIIKSFIAEYSDTPYAEIAQTRLSELTKTTEKQSGKSDSAVTTGHGSPIIEGVGGDVNITISQ